MIQENDIMHYDAEKASNSYLMSTVALIAGLPMPIINLLATFIFFLSNRKSSYFVRFHCIQALFSQILVVLANSFGMYWTLSIIFGSFSVTDKYIAYLIMLFILNVMEIVATVYAAIQVRKRKHVELWVFAPLSYLICKKQNAEQY